MSLYSDIGEAALAFSADYRSGGLLWSCSSVAACLLLVLLYWCCPSTRRTPGWLMFRADLIDLLISASFVFLFLVPPKEEQWRTSVGAIAFGASVVNVSAYSFRSAIYLYLLSIYRNPFQPERHRTWLYLWVAFWTSVTFTVHMFISFETVLNVTIGFFFLPFLVFVIAGGFVMLFVSILLIKSRRPFSGMTVQRSGGSPNISSLASQRVMRHGHAYMVLFGLRLLVGSGMCAAIELKWDPPWSKDVVMALVVGGPVFSLVGWVLINGSFRRCCSCASRSVPNVRRGFLDSEVQTVAMEEQGGVKEAGFKEELRFELIYSVTKSLGVFAQEELQSGSMRETIRRQSHRRHSSFNIEMTSRTTGDGSGDEDPSTFVCDREVSQSFPSFMHFPVARVRSDGYPNQSFRSAARRPSVTSGGSVTSLVEDGGAAGRVRHYSPNTFQNIRDWFGISRSAYAKSFPNDLTDSLDWRKKLKESVSEGKSGCFFYRVLGCGQEHVSTLIVKQVTATEKETLTRILPQYEAHVKDRRGKSFIAYLGCHSMLLNWTMSQKVYFVVMKNFLPASMWLVFDLKGATANRRAVGEDHLFHKGEGVSQPKKYPTLRDWEWLDMAMSVDVSQQDRLEILNIIEEDTKFLGKMHLLDYSLLLGIHRLPGGLSEEQRSRLIGNLEVAGGYVSLDRRKVYFFGIIDVLENYNCRWKMQNCALKATYCLCCWQGVKGISALPPLDYADRFRTFMEKEVLHCHSVFGQDARLDRWSKLWRNRQQGLIRERLEAENDDRLASQEEQEHELMFTRRTGARAASHDSRIGRDRRRASAPSAARCHSPKTPPRFLSQAGLREASPVTAQRSLVLSVTQAAPAGNDGDASTGST